MEIKEKIIKEVKKIYDPEIPVNIYDLGLIYEIKVEKDNNVKVKMTLTTPNCPVAESLPKEVKDSIMEVKGVKEVDLQLVGSTLGQINDVRGSKIRTEFMKQIIKLSDKAAGRIKEILSKIKNP